MLKLLKIYHSVVKQRFKFDEIVRIPEEWLALGDIEGERYPCPGLAFIPKEEGANRPPGDTIQLLNNLYEVSCERSIIYDPLLGTGLLCTEGIGAKTYDTR